MSPPAALPPLHRFPRMMQEYLTTRLRDNYRANQARVMGLSTGADARAYCADVRAKIDRIFGPRPAPAPLNLRVAGELERGAYRLRKLLFDSRPGMTVTAVLYLPTGWPGPRPAVLCPCGHSALAKAGDPYQRHAQALARMGYTVLMYDPLGQGERLQYPDGHGESHFGPGPSYPSVHEHNAMDRQLTLTGDWLGRWFVEDARRALDVLLAQDGVDPARVGVTGVSGGGTLTAYLLACDARITMAAPCCAITSWYHNGSNEEPMDAEQCPPGALAAGLEQSDFLLARAPTPVILLTEEQDFFDQRGSLEAYARLQHVYRLLGAEDRLGYYVGPGTHGYWPGARAAVADFFNRHAGVTAPSPEAALQVEDPQTLRCTPSGQVSDLPGSQTVPQLAHAAALALATTRGSPAGAELRRRVTAVLALPPRPSPPDYRILRAWTPRGYDRSHASHFVLETDTRALAQVVVTMLADSGRDARPARGDGPALLYLPHLSADEELRTDATLRALCATPTTCFACDYRGIGESRPETCRPDSFFHRYGNDYHYAAHARMLGESYVAWRVHDVLSTLDWLAALGYNQVHLVAQGWGSIPGALAALLDDRIRRVTLIHAPVSYAAMVAEPLQQWPLSAMLPSVLTQFDLPEVYRALAAKDLRLLAPWGALMA